MQTAATAGATKVISRVANGYTVTELKVMRIVMGETRD